MHAIYTLSVYAKYLVSQAKATTATVTLRDASREKSYILLSIS